MSLPRIRLQPLTLRAWLWFIVVSVFTCCRVSAAAPASSVSVLVMVRSVDQSDPAPYELRLRSELSTDGIVAIVVNPVSTPGDAKALAARFGTHTTIEVTVSAGDVTGVIWSADPQMGLEVTRNVRVSTRERDAVAVFALRTVDFLQGARLELEQQRQSKLSADAANRSASTNAADAANATAPPATTAQTKPAEAKPRPAPRLPVAASEDAARHLPGGGDAAVVFRERLRLGVAFSLLRSTDKFVWSTAAAVSWVWHWHPKWSLGVAAAGPYLNYIHGNSATYAVTVDQELAAISLRRRIALGTSVDLEPHAGVGGARYSANATAQPPRFGYHATAWSLLGQGGVGLIWRLGPHLRIVADIGIWGRFQTPSVKVDGQDVTGSSPWNLVVGLGPGWAI